MGGGLLGIDGQLELWLLGFVAIPTLTLFVALPLVARMLFRRKGLPVPSYSKRFCAGFGAAVVVTLAGLVGWFIFAFLVAESAPAFVAVLAGLALLAALVAIAWWAVDMAGQDLRPNRRSLPVAIVLTAAFLGTAICAGAAYRRTLTIKVRLIDVANLNAVRAGLALYHGEHGVYPGDLRRLVDAGNLGGSALLPVSSRRYEEIESSRHRPYDGPCEVMYLPEVFSVPGRHACAWFGPEHYRGDGAVVIFTDYEVDWLDADEFARVTEAAKALAAQVAATQPGAATQPAP